MVGERRLRPVDQPVMRVSAGVARPRLAVDAVPLFAGLRLVC